MSEQQRSPRCPNCGGRLFVDSEFHGNRRIYFYECSLGCSRQFDMAGRLRRHAVGERRARVVREVVRSL